MKSIAVFLILNVLLLSSFTGMANIYHGKAACCIAKMYKDCCKHQKQNPDDNCAKGACNAMVPCGTCGFTIISSVSLSPAITDLNDQPAHPFAIGELSDYQDNDWNPPKA
ncbi:hypothetical protein SNE25_12970 [Mucilaginibacter sabulilitoris]|uniref:Uncharacterized protein n=1 Tax=Mucilaginibacter sabulilitoris TaxID=1173583 RepID=A0ABZ0TU83_9SPHI|nr:hypothetical protein [Mucilaginibacter sabulilitoris]WPU96432.1 hypothetical protein SNE25_12970 [Mucilaginibacter sabulilitoris]